MSKHRPSNPGGRIGNGAASAAFCRTYNFLHLCIYGEESDEVFREILEQAENFKRHSSSPYNAFGDNPQVAAEP